MRSMIFKFTYSNHQSLLPLAWCVSPVNATFGSVIKDDKTHDKLRHDKSPNVHLLSTYALHTHLD